MGVVYGGTQRRSIFLHTCTTEQYPSRHALLVHIPACTDIVVACETGLNTCSEPHWLNAYMAQW